jgi:sialidase-1
MKIPLRWITLALVVSTLIGGLRASSVVEKIDVFKPGSNGFAHYRIPGLVVTAKGTILAYCEARKNDREDWGEIEVHLRRSTDGGRTWGAVQHVAHNAPRLEGNPKKKTGGEHEQTVNNPVAIADRDGAVHFLYCVNYAHCFYQRSDDDGLTFTAPVEITRAFASFGQRTAIATGPGHGIQLQNGRLLVPIWVGTDEPAKKSKHESATIYSDDRGKTWRAGAIAIPERGEFIQPNECEVAQLSDGSVMMNARTESKTNRRAISVSADGATGWSAPRFDDALWDAICMGSLIAVPKKPGTLIFATTHNLKLDDKGAWIPGARGQRKNLSLNLSRDDGKTWSPAKTLEPGPSAYSDLGVLPDGTIVCFYEKYRDLTLARFSLDWLEQK